MKLVLKTAMASALAIAAAAPASAQYYGGTPYRPTDQYQQQRRDYENQRAQYDAQRQDYRDQRDAYRAARAAYDRRLADWEARRADYDARYGAGSYIRVYGPAPTWDEQHWAYYVPPGYYAPTAPGYYVAPAAPGYGAPTAYAAPPPAPCNNNSAVTAGIIGALAGGVLGNSVTHGGGRTGGTVLGALVGGGAGAAIGHAHDVQKCDERGLYYSYDDTLPYRTDSDVYRDNRSAYYEQRGCRLAPAAVSDTEYRYVRVCPDGEGRYRVTG